MCYRRRGPTGGAASDGAPRSGGRFRTHLNVTIARALEMGGIGIGIGIVIGNAQSAVFAPHQSG